MPESRHAQIQRDLPPYLQAVADKFDKDADARIRNFLQRMEVQPPPSRLFHYTNDEGFLGVLTSGKLWLSDIFTLNDPSEITYALQAALRAMRKQINSDEMRILSDQLEGFISIDAANAIASYFVCSFSTNGDDLPQWQAYGDNGRGFSLEFDTEALEAAFTKLNGEPIENNSTFPVHYDEQMLEALVQEQLGLLSEKIAFVRKVMPATKEAYGAYMSDLLLTIALHLYRLSLFFKHPAFRHEGEYRFLSLFGIEGQIPDLRSRPRKGASVRYRELDWRSLAPGCLRGIRIGPATNPDAAKILVADCLARTGLTDVQISVSTIPYRALDAA